MLEPLHSLQIIASLDNPSAGPSYTVRRLAEALAARGAPSEVCCTTLQAAPPETRVPIHAYRQDVAGLPLAAKLFRSRAMSAAIDRAAADGAILHSHGLWTLPNLYPAAAARRHGAVHIITPHGMLGKGALQFSRHAKQIFWRFAGRRAMSEATCVQATSRAECDDVRAMGIRQPVAIIPNGIDMPPFDVVAAGKQHRDPNRRTLLHLGRLHPKKGIDRLIDAWARLEPRHPEWSLRIVGPSENGHGEALAAQAARLGVSRVELVGPLFGRDKEKAYRDADIFVLPTLDENFGMVVAEALANGTPVVCTKGAPWVGLETNGCGWWIEHGVDPIAAALEAAMQRPRDALDAMGKRGHAWMAADFSWERVATDMEAVYRWCLIGQDGANPPPTIDIAR